MSGALQWSHRAIAAAHPVNGYFRTCDSEAIRFVSWYPNDIRSDLSNGDSTLDCDAVSISIGFVAVEAQLGTVIEDEPPREPCGNDGVVHSEGALAGTCETVPDELAVSCSPVERRPAVYPAPRVPELCSHDRPRGPVCPVTNGNADCLCQEECDDGENGRCYSYGYHCSYDERFSDDDCGPGNVCQCRGGEDGNHICLPANCRSDGDCRNGLSCLPSLAASCPNLGPPRGYYCQTGADECGSDGDCVGPQGGGVCVFDPALSHWRCSWDYCTVP